MRGDVRCSLELISCVKEHGFCFLISLILTNKGRIS